MQADAHAWVVTNRASKTQMDIGAWMVSFVPVTTKIHFKGNHQLPEVAHRWAPVLQWIQCTNAAAPATKQGR
jgi:hypothetical protein